MVRDTDGLAQSFGFLLKDGTFSDVTLIVGDRQMPAHRVILAARSDYFKAMFTVDLAEKQSKDVILNDTSPAAFQPILNYAYTDTLDIEAMDEQTLLEVLELGRLYQFPWIQKVVAAHLAKTVTIDTVCERLNIAELLEMENVKKACLEPWLATKLLLNQELAGNLSYSAIESVLALDSVQVPEIDRFRAVCGWIEKHKNGDAKPLLSKIRLSLLTMDDLYNVVRPTNHYSKDDIIEALYKRGSTSDLQLLHHLPVQEIEPRRQTFTSSAKEFIMEMESGRSGMIINTVQLTLPSHLDHYSYEVDLSLDGRHSWSTVYGQDHCEGQQTLYIVPQRITDLRIRFSTGTVEQCTPLTVVASYSDGAPADFNTDQRCRAPKHNVATAATARLLPISKRDNRPDVLFNGDMETHANFALGDQKNSLVVRFSQPYYVSSLVFLLNRYKTYWCWYYVEVSDDKTTWNRVCVKSTGRPIGWQVVLFAPQRVVYVRIVFTSALNGCFHGVAHFECPIDEARLPQLLTL